jgi:hypothetical protein
MSTIRWIPSRRVSALVALSLCVATIQFVAGQAAAPATSKATDNTVGFKEFTVHLQGYLKLQKTVESKLPALKPTDLPEMIAAHQQALARRIQEARPHAKAGDVFTPAACEAFRRASLTALDGPALAKSRAYMQQSAATPALRLAVNNVYPDTAPITAPSPELLAVFPPLPAEVAYRVVGRTLIVVDVKSRLIVDIASLVLPPVS